ncbi:MAG: divalent-cation tolerance protein CutA [Parvularculaceae bacterium]|nr:divalent-cation tolerance protein CutA [Parvularculaceae bacterium]
MSDCVILYVTAPDTPTANTLARALIDDRAAACVNVLPGVTSHFVWDGAAQCAEETVMIVKTTTKAAGRARQLIAELHPYDTPAIIALPVDRNRSSGAYLGWISLQTP